MFIFQGLFDTTIIFFAFRAAGGAECVRNAHADEQINLGGDLLVHRMVSKTAAA